jgi:hypothetical protein
MNRHPDEKQSEGENVLEQTLRSGSGFIASGVQCCGFPIERWYCEMHAKPY